MWWMRRCSIGLERALLMQNAAVMLMFRLEVVAVRDEAVDASYTAVHKAHSEKNTKTYCLCSNSHIVSRRLRAYRVYHFADEGFLKTGAPP